MADDQPTRVSHWRLVREPALVTREIVTHDWKGEGTTDDPYLIDFIPNDPRNPVSTRKKGSVSSMYIKRYVCPSKLISITNPHNILSNAWTYIILLFQSVKKMYLISL